MKKFSYTVITSLLWLKVDTFKKYNWNWSVIETGNVEEVCSSKYFYIHVSQII